MDIRFLKDEEEITDIKTEALTFKVGDVIYIEVENKAPGLWNVTPVSGHYKVLEIKPFFKKYYPVSGRVDSVKDIHIVDVVVEEA